MSDPIEVVEWTPAWPVAFRAAASILRPALGDLALRIDHIGSTSVEGLVAKPVIDIQVSVAEIDPSDDLVARMTAAGFVWRSDNPDRSKRYFRETPGARRTHVHVRRAGSWGEQTALLFRDFMRGNPAEHAAYADVKRALAARFLDDRKAYTDGKAEHIWGVIRRADAWAQARGWRPGPTGA